MITFCNQTLLRALVREMAPSIIDQLFRLTISVSAPREIEEAIKQFLPTKEHVQKKRRMNRDIWFFKDHSAVIGYTSYWTYKSDSASVPITDGWADENGFGFVSCGLFGPHRPWLHQRVNDGPSVLINDGWHDDNVYCDQYNLRRTRCIFANSFITWKDDIFSDMDRVHREAYEKMLFDHDGEKTEPFRILTDTSEYVSPTPNLRNKGVFLGGGNAGDLDYTEHGQGITILNIISRAMDGLYTVQWSTSGFGGDDTGDYENDVITIYNTPASTEWDTRLSKEFKNYIETEHEKWSEDPDDEFTGLIIGDRDVDDFSNLVKKTEDGDKLFSIFVKPNWQDIGGGYWGYQRDELVDGKIVNGPRGAEQNCRKFRSQNEMAAAHERGIVMSSEIR
jgi:hypothetical protein